MGKLLLARMSIVALLVLPLGGCASSAEQFLNLPQGVLTKSVANPVTRDTLRRLENGLRVGVIALKGYKTLCNDGTLDASCIQVVATLQGYSKRARPLLKQLRVFVRKNDQINAGVIFAQVQSLIAEFRATATAAGVPMPQIPGA